MNHAPKILVVDDEVHILHVIALKMRNAGFEVLTSQNGAEGLELAQVEQPDLIITDYQMPRLSGLEMCQRLRHIPATSQIPAIMLTARGFQLDQQALDGAGIALCIHKPFAPRQLLNDVRVVLESMAAV